MTNRQRSILVVDDDKKILFAFRELFKGKNTHCLTAGNGEEAITILGSAPVDLVFMDITMPGIDGLEALQRMRRSHPQLPVVLLTGFGSMQTAVKAMQLGAFDYLTKPLDIRKIRDVAQRALASSGTAGTDQAGVIYKADVPGKYELIGNSPAMQEIYKIIGSISTTSNHTSVLLLGESGTGKELVARAIHAHGTNAGKPFVAINCTALPENLLESELFGHEKGAFTGAEERKLGKFEIAHEGTIFLDEIGTLSLSLQKKLLRVLQEREFERVGGNSPVHVDARFIAATNQNLEEEVRHKNFREDLYFRLRVAFVHLPPLRDRTEDIPLLANYFLAKYNEVLKKSVRNFSDDALNQLRQYRFPGNVRELENIVERAVMLTKGGVILPDVLLDVTGPAGGRIAGVAGQTFSEARAGVIERFEEQFVANQLKIHRGNVTAAAEASGMTRQNFQRLMLKYGIRGELYRS